MAKCSQCPVLFSCRVRSLNYNIRTLFLLLLLLRGLLAFVHNTHVDTLTFCLSFHFIPLLRSTHTTRKSSNPCIAGFFVLYFANLLFFSFFLLSRCYPSCSPVLAHRMYEYPRSAFSSFSTHKVTLNISQSPRYQPPHYIRKSNSPLHRVSFHALCDV